MNMSKIGVNQPCPCGSGKKFKKCCRNLTSDSVPLPEFDLQLKDLVQQKLRDIEATRVQREKQQGLGKGIISMESNGHRIVIVGMMLYSSTKWRTFHDFLRYYLIVQLGETWFKAEQIKIVYQRHQIVRWYDKAFSDVSSAKTMVGDLVVMPMTGAHRSFLNLAYNIYLIAHNAENESANALLQTFISKLKSARTDDFIGKLFETYAAAMFLKAGFKLVYENESESNVSHVEFVATYPPTGKKFSVEVKSRNRISDEDGPTDDVKRLRIDGKLRKALNKQAEHTRIVMIEINVPEIPSAESLAGWPAAALQQVRHVEKTFVQTNGEKPNAYVIITNHAFHNNLESIDAGTQFLATGFNFADFGPDIAFNRFKDLLESQERHQEILAVSDSMRTHLDIPVTFDGQIPEMVFQHPRGVRQLKIGQYYQVPFGDGQMVSACLVTAIVLEGEMKIYAIYKKADGIQFIVTESISEVELTAWRRHPDTFFGEVQQVQHTSDNWLELAGFMYQSYKSTPREKLLDWMKDAQDFEQLNTLPQKELAIIYCERMAWSGWNHKSN